jgi:hypothetical protein
MVLFPILLSFITALIFLNLGSIKYYFSFDQRAKWLLISMAVSQVVFWLIYGVSADFIIKVPGYLSFLVFPVLPVIVTIITLKVLQKYNQKK